MVEEPALPTPRLHLVKYGPQANRQLGDLIGEAKSGDPLTPVTVVVPSQYAGLSLRRVLAAKGGLVNVRFMVMPRLAEYLGSPKLASEGRAPLSSLIESVAIREVGSKIASGGPLGPVANHPRLHSSLSRSFQELDHLTEDQLENLQDIDPLRAQIVAWRRQFLDLTKDYYSEGALSRAAAEAVQDGSAAPVLRDLGFIVFHLVQDLSPAERSLIDSLAANARCAMVLGLVGEGPADQWTRELATKMGPVLGPMTEDPDTAQGFAIDQLVSAPDAQEEVRWVVRQIVKRAEEGYRFSRMAVLYQQGGPYAPLIASQLRLAGIPVAGPSPTPLSDTPAGKLLLLFMAVIDSGYSREAVMRWISEAPVRPDSRGSFTSSHAAAWDVASRNAGVVNGLGQWRERLGRYGASLEARVAMAEPLEETTPAKLNGLRQMRSATAGLAAFIEGLAHNEPPADGSNWKAFVDWAKGLLTEHGPNPDEWTEQAQSSMDRISQVLEDIRGLEAVSETTDLDGFRMVLENALQVSSGRVGATGTGVLSAPVSTAVSMDFDDVYVIGMSEGSFPRPAVEDPLLPEQVRQVAGWENPSTSVAERRSKERRSLLGALASASRRVISYSRTDPSARRGQHPSPWLLQFASAKKGEPVDSTALSALRGESWLTWIDSPEDGLRLARDLEYADSHDYDVASVARWRAMGLPLDSHYLAGSGSPISRCLSLESSRESRGLSVWDGQLSGLSDQTNRLLMARGHVFSATRLERWAVCPYRYFLGDVLELSALETPEDLLSISPLDRGTLVHRILERFIGSMIQDSLVPKAGDSWTSAHRSALAAIASEEFSATEAKGITGKALLWDAAKDEVMSDMEAFLESDARWRSDTGCGPIWVERRFGFEDDPESLPPVVLRLGDGTEILLRGVIDRVDIDSAGNLAVITDYKSGRSTAYRDMKDDPLGGGRHLQLPVYALAAREALGSHRKIDSQYWFVSTAGRFERKVVSLPDVEDQLNKVTSLIVSGIKGGIFPATPGSPDQSGRPRNCRYCDFDKICPSNRDVLWERKQGDPLLKAYMGLSPDQDESNDD